MPTIDTALSRQTRDIIGAIQAQRAWKMPVHIVRQQLDAELEFANLLTEDKNNEQMSYVDYLCVVHRQIQTEVKSFMAGVGCKNDLMLTQAGEYR